MIEIASDAVAIAIACVAVVYLLVLMCGLISVRYKPVMAARGARFMAVMCAAGVVHIISATVAHQHSPVLVSLERMACSVWGYWLPYVGGVGVWFTAQYVQILTYSSMLTLRVNNMGLRQILFARPFVALITMLPPVLISVVVSAVPGATRVDPETDACVSDAWAKYLVAAWLGACIIALATSLVCFRRGVTRDPTREWRRQWVVLFASTGATAGQAFVVVFASQGLHSATNRFLATVIIVLLYVTTMSWLALRPLWWFLREDTVAQEAEEEKLVTTQQPVRSVLRLMENSYDTPSRAIRMIISDFLQWCAEPTQERLRRKGGKQTHPRDLVQFYQALDAWTAKNLGPTYDYKKNPYGNRLMGGFAPSFTRATEQSAAEIIATYFSTPYGSAPSENVQLDDIDAAEDDEGDDGEAYAVIVDPLIIPGDMMTTSVQKSRDTPQPVDTFRELMWWTLEVLDRHLGEKYLVQVLHGRPVYLQEDVRLAYQATLQRESHTRLQHAGVRIFTPDQRRAVAAGVRLPPNTGTVMRTAAAQHVGAGAAAAAADVDNTVAIAELDVSSFDSGSDSS